MLSPQPAPVVIACPHCGTRYRVDYETIGTKGRRVACAHCGKDWLAKAERPVAEPVVAPKAVVVENRGFGDLAEEALDQKFVTEERRHQERREASARTQAETMAAQIKSRAEALNESRNRSSPVAKAGGKADLPGSGEVVAFDAGGDGQGDDYQRTLDEIKAAISPKAATTAPADAATRKRQQKEFSARQRTLYDTLPIARLRRVARLAALAAMVLVFGGGIMARTQIVQQFPQLAGAYAAIGLGVNVIGLEFGHVRTLKSLQNGAEVLAVDGDIQSVAGHEVPLPQVIVTLIGKKGTELYEWSMTPKASTLEPGETLAFETQLTAPPQGATGVKLTFANGRSQSRPFDTPVPDEDSVTPTPAAELAADGAGDQ